MTNHNLLPLEDIFSYQDIGEWPMVDSSMLSSIYENRWEMADKLFAELDENLFNKVNEEKEYTSWKDPKIPEKSYSKKYSGSALSYDDDYMVGPHDWDSESKIGDYVQRRKAYIYDWTKDGLQHTTEAISYFTGMHEAFKPVLEHYLYECYSDQLDLIDKLLYKLMIIQYNTPIATEETRVQHRKFNTERFGDEHCDETLGGLHLGENYAEFRAKNTKSNKWELIHQLTENKMLWMFGENAERSGLIPTYHGMQHNPGKDLNTRYSIIFDLQARYKK